MQPKRLGWLKTGPLSLVVVATSLPLSKPGSVGPSRTTIGYSLALDQAPTKVGPSPDTAQICTERINSSGSP